MPATLETIDTNIVDAFRAAWRGVVKATTGARSDISVDATTGEYVRLAGSFLDDGFDAGDEATVTGFGTSSNNGLSVVTYVEALRMRVYRPWDPAWALVTEAAGAAVTIRMALPEFIKYAGWSQDPKTSRPWLRETYKPVMGRPATLGSSANPARVRRTGTYWLTVFYPSNTGTAGASRLRGKINALIVAGGQLSAGGQVVRIAGADPKGEDEEETWTGLPISFPFTADTFNP